MKRPRVLVVEPVDSLFDKLLNSHGVVVHRRIGIPRADLLKIVGEYEALVVRGSTIVDRELLEHGCKGRLRVIARAGVGLDNIDLKAAKELGVQVISAPGASTQSVAELTIALMIMAVRRLLEVNMKLRNGVWYRPLGMELYGKTLFIVGFGRIGRRVAEIAKSIGMKVLAYDIIDVSKEAEKRGVTLVNTLLEGLEKADIVSLHVPLTPLTYHMINKATLQFFKKGSVLVNTARGKVIDTEAVLKALDENILSAVAIDVHENEPPTARELKLINHPRVVATPHIGAQTIEAQKRVAELLAKNLLKTL